MRLDRRAGGSVIAELAEAEGAAVLGREEEVGRFLRVEDLRRAGEGDQRLVRALADAATDALLEKDPAEPDPVAVS